MAEAEWHEEIWQRAHRLHVRQIILGHGGGHPVEDKTAKIQTYVSNPMIGDKWNGEDSTYFPWGLPSGLQREGHASCRHHNPQLVLGLPMIKNPPANAGELRDAGSIPGPGRFPGGGHGNTLWYPCLENPMDRGAWQTTVHRVAKSQMWLKRLNTHKQPVQDWVAEQEEDPQPKTSLSNDLHMLHLMGPNMVVINTSDLLSSKRQQLPNRAGEPKDADHGWLCGDTAHSCGDAQGGHSLHEHWGPLHSHALGVDPQAP